MSRPPRPLAVAGLLVSLIPLVNVRQAARRSRIGFVG